MTSATTPSVSWSARRATGSQPPRHRSSKRLSMSSRTSSVGRPAAATNQNGTRLLPLSMSITSPSASWWCSRGARSRYAGSMRSMYVPGGSVTCESAEMQGPIVAVMSRSLARFRWRGGGPRPLVVFGRRRRRDRLLRCTVVSRTTLRINSCRRCGAVSGNTSLPITRAMSGSGRCSSPSVAAVGANRAPHHVERDQRIPPD